MAKANPIVSLQVTTHRNYINAVVSREHGDRHHSSITPASRLRLSRAQRHIIRATPADDLPPYSFGYKPGTKRVVRWTAGELDAAPAALCEYDDCDQAALPGGDFCAIHQAEHDELMTEAEPIGDLAEQYNEAVGTLLAEQLGDPDTISPESNTELSQLITNEFEAAEQPVRMCEDASCVDAAAPGYAVCWRHLQGYLETKSEARWTAGDILRREG